MTTFQEAWEVTEPRYFAETSVERTLEPPTFDMKAYGIEPEPIDFHRGAIGAMNGYANAVNDVSWAPAADFFVEEPATSDVYGYISEDMVDVDDHKTVEVVDDGMAETASPATSNTSTNTNTNINANATATAITGGFNAPRLLRSRQPFVITDSGRTISNIDEAGDLVKACMAGAYSWATRGPNAEERLFAEVPGNIYAFRREFSNADNGERWIDHTQWGPARSTRCSGQNTARRYHEVLIKHRSAPRGQPRSKPLYRAHGLEKKVFGIVVIPKVEEYVVISYWRPDPPPPTSIALSRIVVPAPISPEVERMRRATFKELRDSRPADNGYKNEKRKGMAKDYKDAIYRPVCNHGCGRELANIYDRACPQGHMQ